MKTQSRKKESEPSKQEKPTQRKIITISYYTAAVVIAAVAFIHIYLPVDNSQVTQTREAHQEAKAFRNDLRGEILSLNADYYNQRITLSEFNGQLPALLEKYQQYEEESKALFSTLSEVKKENEILGFSSWHTFLATLADPLVIFCLAIFLFVNAYAEDRKFLKQAKLLLASTACIIGCFFLTWVFVDLPDLPFWSYVSVMFICALLATAGTRYVTQWLYFRRASVAQFRKIIKLLIDFIVIDVRDKYLKKEKEEEYINDTFKTLEKGLEQ